MRACSAKEFPALHLGKAAPDLCDGSASSIHVPDQFVREVAAALRARLSLAASQIGCHPSDGMERANSKTGSAGLLADSIPSGPQSFQARFSTVLRAALLARVARFVPESAAMLVSEDLIGEFERAACAAAASVERIECSPDAIATAVLRAAPDIGRIAVAETLDVRADLFDACRRLPSAFTARSKDDLKFCDVGITDAFAGVARTGSVCVCVDHDHAGYISLLSRMHMVVLAAENIVQRPGDLLRADRLDGKGLRRNFVFITGPSATADMGPLVRGVHGPHRLHVILLT